MKSRRFISLSSSYFFYFSVLGLVVPFLAIFLHGKNFSSIEIGEIIAMFLATKMIGPTFWAYLSDKSGKQLSIIRLGSFLSLFFFCFLFVVEQYWSIAFVLALFSLFWTAILPQLEVMTSNTIRQQPKIYARIRLWGSIGFIVIAVCTGELIERFGSKVFIYIGITILSGLFISTLHNQQPRISASHNKKSSALSSKILCSSFIVFFLAGILLQVSFGPYYTFFALYLQTLNYSGLAIGLLIALGVVAEIIVFIYAGIIFKHFSAKVVLVFAVIITALRWFMIGSLCEYIMFLMLAQLIHAASFGLYHSASLIYLQKHFDKNQQSRGQAIYVGGVYGVGGALGAYFSGVLWNDGIGAYQTFLGATTLALIAGGLLLMLPKNT